MSSRGRGSRVLLALCLFTLGVAGYLRGSPSAPLGRILGGLDPLVVVLAALVVGLPALRVARARGFVAEEPRGGRPARDAVRIALVGTVLPVPMILLDAIEPFPEGINVPAPEALLAYPAIGFVAELLFHAVPLGFIALLWPRDAGSTSPPAPLVALAALPEPILQVGWGLGHSPLWANVLVGLQLLSFNAVGLVLLWRYGFLSPYILRLGYYATWHVLWGELRLDLLFAS